MSPRVQRLFLSVVLGIGSWVFYRLPSPEDGLDPLLIVVQRQSPMVYQAFSALSVVAPVIVAFVLLSVAHSVVELWMASLIERRTRGKLPAWPLDATDPGPAIVIGERHYKTANREHPHPKWIVMPEKGLYTGLAIFGAIGTGKTTSCMRPFCRQLLEWQNHQSEKRVAMLVLEVKGDFCYDVKEMLEQYGRQADYMELSLDPKTGWKWNPLNAPWLDTYSLAYTLASLVNQLFGKGKEPFWQQAYTAVIRWIVECYRSFDDPWFTFSDIQAAMVSDIVLSTLIERNVTDTYSQYSYRVDLEPEEYKAHKANLDVINFTEADVVAGEGLPANPDGTPPFFPQRAELGPDKKGSASFKWSLKRNRHCCTVNDKNYHTLCWYLTAHKVDFTRHVLTAPPPDQVLLTTKISSWYADEWKKLDPKLRSSVVVGMSVFLGIFVVPETARIFCPPNPNKMTPEDRIKNRMMPPLDEAIEAGRVLALNMPAGTNPALARAAGVMLKQSWLSTLLLRPKAMKRDAIECAKTGAEPRFFRPAVFVCDEYQSFATCGEDDPGGDEKAFALTRQSKCIPIVATQSISSLKAVLGDGDSWRALLQTLRSRIFLSLADDFSQKTASELLGQVNRMRASYSISENTGKASASILSGKVGGGAASAGYSKSFSEKREPLFHPRDLLLLGTCQAICQIFDGATVADAQRVFLKPDYKPRDLAYWRWYEKDLAPKT